jgi:hypothetical protein
LFSKKHPPLIFGKDIKQNHGKIKKHPLDLYFGILDLSQMTIV